MKSIAYNAFWLAALVCPPASAQTVRGVTLDASDRPVGGVVVILVDTNSREVGRALSNERGEFRLQALAPGAYRVRTLRIGYAPFDGELTRLGTGAELSMSVKLSGLAVNLDTIRVVGSSRCRSGARDSADAVFALWDQARNALLAAQLTLANRSVNATTLAFEQTLDAASRRVRAQEYDVRSDYLRVPWKPAPSGVIRSKGYVYTTTDNIRVYEAPDLEVLLSQDFIDDHCLTISSRSDATRLGVAFSPVPSRRVPEIKGTLWIDRKTAHLVNIEYEYVNVSPEERDESRGEMRFGRMRDGGWVIARWEIRMPAMALVPVFERFVEVRKELRLDSIKVRGGELVLVTTADRNGRDTLFARPPRAFRGRIVDSVSGRGVSPATVNVPATSARVTVDRDGRFLLNDLLPGRYEIEVRTPSLDSLGVSHVSTVLLGDTATHISVRVQDAGQFVTALCAVNDVVNGYRVILGSVDAPNVTSKTDVQVTAEWNDPRGVSQSVSSRLDARGKYTLCGIPRSASVMVSASYGELNSGATIGTTPTSAFVRLDLRLRASFANLAGLVVDSGGTPIADAEIVLPAAGQSARTDGSGNFRIGRILQGNHRVMVRKVGYTALDTTLMLAVDSATNQRIVLSRITLLDSMSSVTSRVPDPMLAAFEERRRMGLGHFVTRAEIEKREGSLLSSFIQVMPRLNLLSARGREWVEGKRPTPSSCGAIPRSPGPRFRESAAGRCLMREGVFYVPDEDEMAQGMPIGCYSRVYLDRQLLNPGSPTPPFNIRELVTSQVEAIEWYSGPQLVPPQYMTRNSSCGVLIVHTRR